MVFNHLPYVDFAPGLGEFAEASRPPEKMPWHSAPARRALPRPAATSGHHAGLRADARATADGQMPGQPRLRRDHHLRPDRRGAGNASLRDHDAVWRQCSHYGRSAPDYRYARPGRSRCPAPIRDRSWYWHRSPRHRRSSRGRAAAPAGSLLCPWQSRTRPARCARRDNMHHAVPDDGVRHGHLRVDPAMLANAPPRRRYASAGRSRSLPRSSPARRSRRWRRFPRWGRSLASGRSRRSDARRRRSARGRIEQSRNLRPADIGLRRHQRDRALPAPCPAKSGCTITAPALVSASSSA